MDTVRTSRQGGPAPTVPFRAMAIRAAKLACGAALLVALSGIGTAQPAAAQDDDTIVLTAGGSTLTVSPGNASAVSAVAEAHASPGHAETIAAAARAVADCEDGALAEGAAALAVAHPDEGAATQSAVSEIVAKNNKDDKPIRKVVENKCKVDEKEEKKAPPKKEPAPAPAPEPAPAPPVQELPATGVGALSSSGLSSLFAAASAAAALGAAGFRRRDISAAVLGLHSER